MLMRLARFVLSKSNFLGFHINIYIGFDFNEQNMCKQKSLWRMNELIEISKIYFPFLFD